MRVLPFVGVAIVLTVILIASSVFRVDERQQALVLQFGQVRQVVTEPGLGFKMPLIQDVVFYEDRILPLETSALEVTPADERRLVVDAFARWRITDVVQFRQSVQTETNATQRLENILNASLREVLGSVQSSDVLSPERTVLMSRIRDSAARQARALGVEIIDVRIRRADLPEQNLQATFNRMEAERQREAFDERARGEERAQEVRATADREATELVSDAKRQADVIRGEADAERNNIFASAFGRDPEFFAFYRSLAAYETGLRGSNSTMVITPDSEFFDYLKSDQGDYSDSARGPGTVLDSPSEPEGSEGSGSETEGESEDDSASSSGPPNMAAAASGESSEDGGDTLLEVITGTESDDAGDAERSEIEGTDDAGQSEASTSTEDQDAGGMDLTGEATGTADDAAPEAEEQASGDTGSTDEQSDDSSTQAGQGTENGSAEEPETGQAN